MSSWLTFIDEMIDMEWGDEVELCNQNRTHCDKFIIREARYQHCCDSCYNDILKGEKHGVKDGFKDTKRIHIDCAKRAPRISIRKKN